MRRQSCERPRRKLESLASPSKVAEVKRWCPQVFIPSASRVSVDPCTGKEGTPSQGTAGLLQQELPMERSEPKSTLEIVL